MSCFRFKIALRFKTLDIYVHVYDDTDTMNIVNILLGCFVQKQRPYKQIKNI